MMNRPPASKSQIGWKRLRAIFGNPQPPRNVWERQFDYFDDELRRLAATPYDEMDFHDLWYYYLDLAYVELQPELFNYLFPACLMDWHQSLSLNMPCDEFHRCVHQGNVFERMMTTKQLQAVYEFFGDSFLERLDAERGFLYLGSKTPAYAWLGRFIDLGVIMPEIKLLWNPWWSLETPGRAVAALQYCSSLMYFQDDNPLFGAWTPEQGGGCPPLWGTDGWCKENVDFLSKALTVDFVKSKVAESVRRLIGEPEEKKARRLEADLPEREEIIVLRVRQLPLFLNTGDGRGEWSV